MRASCPRNVLLSQGKLIKPPPSPLLSPPSSPPLLSPPSSLLSPPSSPPPPLSSPPSPLPPLSSPLPPPSSPLPLNATIPLTGADSKVNDKAQIVVKVLYEYQFGQFPHHPSQKFCQHQQQQIIDGI